MGPRQKFPYIAIDGEYIYDSNFIIAELSKRFNVDKLQIKDQVVNAQGHLIRRCIDEAFTWAMAYSRWADKELSPSFLKMAFGSLPTPFRQLVLSSIVFDKDLWTNGVARHPPQEVYKLGSDTLAALATILGDKEYLLTDSLSLCDISMFCSLAGILYLPIVDSPLRKALISHDNLMSYLERIRATYFNDSIKAYSLAA
eukprot:gene11233-13104_t